MEPVSKELSSLCTAKCVSQHRRHPSSKRRNRSATRDWRGTALGCAWDCISRGNGQELEPARCKNYNSQDTSRELRASLYFIAPAPAAKLSKTPPQGFSSPRPSAVWSRPRLRKTPYDVTRPTFVWGAGIEGRSLVGVGRPWDRGRGSRGTAAMLHPEPVSQLLDL